MVPIFFALQLYCCRLIIILNTKKGVPADPKVRNARASAGGTAKNYGEEELKAMISVFIYSQNPKPKYSSMEKFFNDLNVGFGGVLEMYQNRLKNQLDTGDSSLKFGKNFKTESILRKLNQWKSDPEFRALLDRVCILR